MRCSFAPDLDRTAAIDLGIRRALAESVTLVLQEASRAGVRWAGDDAAWRDRLLATRSAPPRLWACYHDMVQAVVRADEAAVTAAIAELLCGLPGRSATPGRVLALDDADLRESDAARYRAVIDNNPAQPLGLISPSHTEVARIGALLPEARSLLVAADAVLLDEVDVLGHEVVLATSAGPGAFGGAATVFLWGAVVLNPALVPDRVTLVESLAHETAHALLFGLTAGADLTTNPPEERHASPLRPDLRPIEGIVHATYVLARMNYALAKLQEVNALTAAERAQVAVKLERNAANYRAGLATVDAHARFTAEGAAIFDACRQAMARA